VPRTHRAGRKEPSERCVFALEPGGLRLAEVAPDIDVERDILAHMAFPPVIGELRTMDPRLYRPKPMQLLAALVDLKLGDRLSYDPERNTLFANFEGPVDPRRRRHRQRAPRGRGAVPLHRPKGGAGRQLRRRQDRRIGGRRLLPMVAELQARYYSTAVRYTTSAFMRLKLGNDLSARRSLAHVFETRAEALAFAQRKHSPDADA
jgi:propionate CoA-transferase